MSYEQASVQLDSFCKERKVGFLVQNKSGKIFYYKERPRIKKRFLFKEKEFENLPGHSFYEYVCQGKVNEDWKNSIVDLSQDKCVLVNGVICKLILDPIYENHKKFRLLMNIIDQKNKKTPPIYSDERIKEILTKELR